MKITAEPRSDQWNAEDFLGGPRTFTIAGVKVGTAEQKYDLELVEGAGRVWRPPLTVLRLLIKGWGDDATAWVGRRVTLYLDPTITFGRDKVGGIRVSHMSDLEGGKGFEVQLTATRGKRVKHTVLALPDAAPAPTPDALAAQLVAALPDATTEAEVREWGNRASDRGLLDVIVAGQTVREHVTARIVEVAPDA